MKKILGTSAIFLAILAGLQLSGQEPHHFEPGFNLFSKQQDIQLGEESAAQVRKQRTVIK